MATFKNNLKQIQLGGDNTNDGVSSYPDNLASILGAPYRLWVNNNEDDPGIFTIGNKGNIVRIGGSGGGGEQIWKAVLTDGITKATTSLPIDVQSATVAGYPLEPLLPHLQVKTHNGQKYLSTDLPIVSEQGVTMYTGTPILPSVFESIPLDPNTLKWQNGAITVVGGTGGGEGTVTAVKIGSQQYNPTDGIVSLPAYPSVPAWALQSSKPTYTFAEIAVKPTTLAGYGITDGVTPSMLSTAIVSALNGYATQTWVNQQGFLKAVSWNDVSGKPTTVSGFGITDAVTTSALFTTLASYATQSWVNSQGFLKSDALSDYVTKSTAQGISGDKDFTGALKVNGSQIVYDKNQKYWKLTGDLLVTGSITYGYNDGAYTPSTLLDLIPVDSNTLSKSGGVLTVIGGGAKGTVIAVKIGSQQYNPTDGIVSLPAYPDLTGYATQSWVNSQGFSKNVPAWAMQANKPAYTYSEVGAAAASHTHTKSQITDFPSSMPASDVYAWAKAATKPSYSFAEITGKPTAFYTLPAATASVLGGVKQGSGLSIAADGTISANLSASHIPSLDASKITSGVFAVDRIPNLSISKITNFPTSMPASDVYAWAKASVKPTYTYSEVGAPSTTGVNASGTWGINISGTANIANYLVFKDLRGIATTPETYTSPLFTASFRSNASAGLNDGGGYVGVVGCRKYGSGTDWTGGKAAELGFTDNSNLWIRFGTNTTWEAWKKILDSGNYSATLDTRYVTLSTSQTITGEKNYTGGLKVNGSPIVYDAANKYWLLTGDLLVTGAVTFGANVGTYTPSTLLDLLPVDAGTLSKTGGVLKVIGGGGTPISVYGYGNLATTFSDADRNNTFNAYTISTKFKEFDTFKAGLSGNYLPTTGGTLSGNVTFSGANILSWTRNTDFARISFKNDSDADTDSYMLFEVGDNGNEYFKWRSYMSGGTITDWMTLKSDGLRVGGNMILHAGNYNSYAPTLTGSGASGTWGINTTGTWQGYNASGMMRRYTITVGGDTDKFYPCTWVESVYSSKIIIHSPSLTETAPYNQNFISFEIASNGWSDMPKTLDVYQHGMYSTNEVTIHSIHYGLNNGANAVYLRGGTTYYIEATTTITPRLTEYTLGTEVFRIMSNDGTVSNANVLKWWGYADGRTMARRADLSAYLPLTGGTLTGNLTAPTFIGALSGNATTATTLQTARTLTIGNTAKAFNGSANVSWALDEIDSSIFRYRNAATTEHVDLTNTGAGAAGFINYQSGTYQVVRSGYSQMFIKFRGAGSSSGLEFLFDFQPTQPLRFRGNTDSNRISSLWRNIWDSSNSNRVDVDWKARTLYVTPTSSYTFGLCINPDAYQWAYIRMQHASVTKWDIGTSNVIDGAIPANAFQIRPQGLNANAFYITTAGEAIVTGGYLSVGSRIGRVNASRSELHIITPTANPCDLWLGHTGAKRWSITSRVSEFNSGLGFYDNDSNAYRLAINGVNGYVGIGLNNTAASYMLHVNGSTYFSGIARVNGWLYTIGNVGWYNETHGGGIYMTDSTWVRIYNNKNLLVSNVTDASLSVSAASDSASFTTLGGIHTAKSIVSDTHLLSKGQLIALDRVRSQLSVSKDAVFGQLDSNALALQYAGQFGIESNNNAMVIGLDNVTNSRYGWIQVGHNSSVYGTVTGTLNLNPRGGNVTVGGGAFIANGLIASATRIYTGYDSGYANAISCSGNFFSSGATGWRNATYGTGIYSEESGVVRLYSTGRLKVFNTTSAANNTASIYTAGGVYADGNIQAALGFSVNNTSATSRYGISLYGAALANPAYGILFTGTSGFGTHGGVTSDWATYFTMSDTTNRGWIFRRGVTNVASISGNGDMLLNGSLTFNSDMRLKDIVKNRMLTVNQIANAPLFDYTYKYDETKQLRSGTSAQYWKNVLPTVVSGSEHLSMDYSSLGVVLGISLANHFKVFLADYEKKEDARDKKIRELEKEVEELKRRLAA